MTNTSAILGRKAHLPHHLAELRNLVRREVSEADLLSLEDTNALREKAKANRPSPLSRVEVPFSDKNGARFAALVDQMRCDERSVYIWTPLSNVCGLLRPVHLSEVNFGFEFDINPEGILVILTSDLVDKLLLDFSDNDAAERVIEIETSGPRWGTMRY